MPKTLALVAVIIAASCRPLPLGEARTADGVTLDAAAATYGDDLLQLMLAPRSCEEFIAFRNFPSWQFDSCDTCFGKTIGSGILSSRSELCGIAYGYDWTSPGECGASLTVESNSASEISGSLRIEKSSGGSLSLEFRAPRLSLEESPKTSSRDGLCESGSDRLGSSACCNWTRDEKCPQLALEEACQG